MAKILDLLVSDGRIDVESAAERFGVSTATIRRDLDHLASQQLLTRTHGGARPNTTSYDLPMRYKAASRSDAKLAIAHRAVQLLTPGCTVALNGGTTTLEIARAIGSATPLHNGVTVLTNALNLAAELTVRPFVKIMVCGGVARPQSYELVGPLAAETLNQFTPDICFLGAMGLDPSAGVTTTDEAESAINRIMVRRSRRTVVVADASKLGEVGFARICHVDEVDAVLVDSGADPAILDEIAGHGVDVITADPV